MSELQLRYVGKFTGKDVELCTNDNSFTSLIKRAEDMRSISTFTDNTFYIIYADNEDNITYLNKCLELE